MTMELKQVHVLGLSVCLSCFIYNVGLLFVLPSHMFCEKTK